MSNNKKEEKNTMNICIPTIDITYFALFSLNLVLTFYCGKFQTYTKIKNGLMILTVFDYRALTMLCD